MKATTKIEPVTACTEAGRQHAFRYYWQMTKPTIGMMVVVTVIPSLVMAQPVLPDLLLSAATLLGTFLASCSAGIFNHLVDSDIDGSMTRTKERPLPSGRVSKAGAVAFAISLGLAAFVILYALATPLAAWLAIAANAFYVVAYTMYLKRRTMQNIVIGGAAGAVGPLIGWAAVTGTLDLPAWILFLIIFLWTPPHFWALAIKYKDDYSRVNIPMLPSVMGVEVTKKQIFAYTLMLIPSVLAIFVLGYGGWIYLAVSLAITLRFVWLAFRLLKTPSNEGAMGVFYFSLLYVFGIFGALTIDRMVALF